jgi:hypothetical protein
MSFGGYKMGIMPKDPVKRKEFVKLVRIILVVITVGFIAATVFMIVGFTDVDKRKFVYKSCVKNLYQKESELKNARVMFQSSNTPENEKLFREAEESYNKAVQLKAKALKAMKEIGLGTEIRNIDNEIGQKYGR